MQDFSGLRPAGWISTREDIEPEFKSLVPDGWVEADTYDTDYIPARLRGTEYEREGRKVTNLLLGQGDDGFQRAVDLDAGRLSWALQAFRNLSPEVASKAQELADRRGEPFEIVAGSPKQYQEWAEATDTINSLMETYPDGRLKYPVIASYLADPAKMAQARDDVGSLRDIERAMLEHDGTFVRKTAYELGGGVEDLKLSGLNVVRALADLAESASGEFAPDAQPVFNAIADKVERAVAEQKADIPFPLQQNRRYWYDFIRTAPQFAASIGLGATVGPAAAGVFVGGHVFGSTYGELKDQGVSPERAALAAVGNALGQGVLETAGAAAFLRMFGSGAGPKEMLKAILQEAGTEFLQAYPDALARVFGEQEITGETDFSRFIDQLPETTVQGLYEGLLTLPIGLLGASGKLAYEYGRRKQSISDQNWYASVRDILSRAKVGKRSPAIVEDVVQQTAMGQSAPSSVYLSREAVQEFFQDDSAGYERFLELLGLEDQAKDVESTGKEFEIDSGKWFAQSNGQDFEPVLSRDLRMSLDGFTQNEMDAQSFRESLASDIDALTFRLKELRAKETVPPDVGTRISAIKETLSAPREAGGLGLTAAEADANIAVLLEGAKVISRKSGETLTEWFSRVNPMAVNSDRDTKKRGSVQFKKGSTLISLFKTADRSTFLHETGHIFASEIERLVAEGSADEILLQDVQIMREYAGGNFGKGGPAGEKFAHAFEAYLSEGRAPSIRLAEAFRRFRNWLTAIYKSLRGSPVEITDDIRGVFSRLLASERDIEEATQFYNMTQSLSELITIPVDKAARIQKKKDKAREDALTRQVKRYMKIHLDTIGGRAAVREFATAEVDGLPEYRALSELSAKGAARFNPIDIENTYGLDVRKILGEKGVIGKRPTTPKESSLYAEIIRLGGINPGTLDESARRTYRENGLFGVFRNEGRGIDELAQELLSKGVVPYPPSDRNLADYVEGLLFSKYVVPSGDAELAGRYVTPEEVALEFGYDSPDAAVRALVEAKPRKDAIRDRVSEILAEKEAKFLADINQREQTAGDEAIHSDASLEYLIAEHQVLSEKVESAERQRPERVQALAFKAAARDIIRRTPFSKAIRYDLYARSEQRYSKAAFDALVANDLQRATDARRQQILNHAVVKESIGARDFKQKFDRKYQVNRVKKRLANTEHAYAEAAADLIASYKIVSTRGIDARPGALDLSALDDTIRPLVPEWIQRKLRAEDIESVGELTYEQVQELDATIDTLLAYGRDELKSITDARFRTYQEFVDAAVSAAEGVKDKKIHGTEFSIKRKAFDIVDGFLARATQIQFAFERFDNYQFDKTGTFGPHRTLFQRGTEAEVQYNETRRAVFESVRTDWDNLNNARKRLEKRFGGKSFELDFLPVNEAQLRIGREAWTVERLIALMLNHGNEGNIVATQNFYGYDEAQINQVFSLFTSEEIQSVQNIWDVTDTLFPELDRVYFSIYNRHLEKVTPLPREVQSANGDTVQLKGGYYPLVFDHKLNRKAAKFAEDDLLKNQTAAVFRSTKPADGVTYARVQGHSLPPALNLGVWFNHIAETARYISHAEYLRDLNRITLNEDWEKMVVAKAGEEMYKQIRDWVSYQARPERRVADSFWSNFLEKQRSLATIAVLGANFSVGLKQRFSLFSAAAEIGWQDIIQAMAETGPQTSVLGREGAESWQKILDASPYLRTRAGSIDRDIRDTTRKFSPFVKKFELNGREFTLKDLQDFMFEWIQMNDRATVGVVWQAAYNKRFRENGGVHAESVTYADNIVQTTQPSALPIDQASLQRSENAAIRLFTSFMTWTLKYGNRLKNANKAYWVDDAISTNDYMRKMLYESVISPWGAAIVSSLWASGELPEWWTWLTSPLENLVSWIPFLRDVGGAIRYRSDIGQSTAFEGLTRIKDVPVSAFSALRGDKAWHEFLWSLGYAAEFQAGIPAQKVARDIKRVYGNIINKGGD